MTREVKAANLKRGMVLVGENGKRFTEPHTVLSVIHTPAGRGRLIRIDGGFAGNFIVKLPDGSCETCARWDDIYLVTEESDR